MTDSREALTPDLTRALEDARLTAADDESTPSDRAVSRHLLAEHARAERLAEAVTEPYDGSRRPEGSNADEWCLFLSEWSKEYACVQIAEAIEAADSRITALEAQVATLREALGDAIDEIEAWRAWAQLTRPRQRRGR